MKKVLAAVLVLGAGCAHVPTMVSAEPVKATGQDVLYKNGVPIILSQASASDLALAPKAGPTGRYGMGDRLYLLVAIRNRGSQRIEVSEASFTATGNGAPARVVRAVELEDAALSDAAWSHAMNAFVTGAAALSNGLAAGTTTFSGTASYTDSMGRSAGSATVSGQSFNQAAAAQAQRQAAADGQARAEVIAASERAQLHEVATLLQRSTLLPGEAMSGVLVIEPPRLTACAVTTRLVREEDVVEDVVPGPCMLTISAVVGDDRHEVSFSEVLPAVQSR